MSLRKQASSSLLWTFMDSFFLKGLSFIASLILARILGPEEFGLIGMISVFIAVGISMVDSGLSASIIRTKNADNSDYSTVFYLNLLMSFLTYGLLFLSAPYIAQFYNQDILINIIRLYCLSFIISAFSAVQLAILNRDMHFKKIMRYNIPGTVIGVIIGVSMGYLGYGVWSIVWLYLSTQIVQSVVLWGNSNWKPSLLFSREKMNFHYGFGYKLMLSALIDTVFRNIYNILIGKFFSVQILGFYERAKSFNDYPVTILTNIISKVSYPLLAQIQDQKERIANIYKQLLQFTFFIIAPLMLGASAIAKPLFLLILGEQWVSAVPFFQILCLSGIFYPIHAFNINVLKVYGRSDLFLRLEVIKKIIISISIIITFQFGIYGLVWSSVFTSIIALLINTHYSSQMIKYTTMDQVKDMLPTFFKAGLMALLMYGLVLALINNSLYSQILISSFTGVSFYFLINYLFKSSPFIFTINLIKEQKL